MSKIKKIPRAFILLIIFFALISSASVLYAEQGRYDYGGDNPLSPRTTSSGDEGFIGAPHRGINDKDLDDVGLMALAGSLSEKGDAEAAIEAYKVLVDRFPTSGLRLKAYYEIGLLKYWTGDIKGAKSYLERILFSWGADPALKNRTRSLVREIDSIYKRGRYRKDTVAIGALLPVKGPYARYGEAALRGVLMAADVFGGVERMPVEVVVKDTGADPSRAKKAASAITGNRHVVGIVGPLLSSTAYRTVTVAQRRGVPVIALSHTKEIAGTGDFVFRNSLTPGEQARAVAGYAYKNLGKRKFAVLYPDNNYGNVMARSFIEEVAALGAEITSVGSYKYRSTDFSAVLEGLFKIEVNEVAEGRRTIKEYEPTAEVDALYIPDNYRAVSLIVPYLKYYNIEGVQLLGSNGWDSEKLIELSGRSVEGAVFVDGFFVGSARPGTSEFVERFKKTYGFMPGVIEAQAYDAAGLLIAAAMEGGTERPDREALRKRLLSMKGYRGAAGRLSFDSRGESIQKPFLLTVKNGRIVEAGKGL
ncbi:MAG: penicillin-binding protein activator [Thermodesulfobacteriota bacterium]